MSSSSPSVQNTAVISMSHYKTIYTKKYGSMQWCKSYESDSIYTKKYGSMQWCKSYESDSKKFSRAKTAAVHLSPRKPFVEMDAQQARVVFVLTTSASLATLSSCLSCYSAVILNLILVILLYLQCAPLISSFRLMIHIPLMSRILMIRIT